MRPALGIPQGVLPTYLSYRLIQKAIRLLYRYKSASFPQPIVFQIRILWQSMLTLSRPLQRRIVNTGMQHPWNNRHRVFDVPLQLVDPH